MGEVVQGEPLSTDDATGEGGSGGSRVLPSDGFNPSDEGWIPVINRKQRRSRQQFYGNGSKGMHQGAPHGNMNFNRSKVFGSRADQRNAYANSGGNANKQGVVPNLQQKPSKPQPAWRFQSGASSTSWKDVCSLGRKIQHDCNLQYYPPSKDSNGNLYVSIPKSEIEVNVQKWSNTLVGYVLGDKPFYSHLKGCVGRLWKLNCSLEIHSRENGYFFFKFGNKEEFERILNEGPWLFDGRLIILKPWSENIGLERDLLSSVPVWIRLPSLHLKLWSQNIVGRIASLIGIPLYMDSATASGERLAYARCFVEISSNSKLPTSVKMEIGNGEWLETPVQYEWLPPNCVKCCNFGHLESQCPIITVEKWVPKQVSNDKNANNLEQELAGSNDNAGVHSGVGQGSTHTADNTFSSNINGNNLSHTADNTFSREPVILTKEMDSINSNAMTGVNKECLLPESNIWVHNNVISTMADTTDTTSFLNANFTKEIASNISVVSNGGNGPDHADILLPNANVVSDSYNDISDRTFTTKSLFNSYGFSDVHKDGTGSGNSDILQPSATHVSLSKRGEQDDLCAGLPQVFSDASTSEMVTRVSGEGNIDSDILLDGVLEEAYDSESDILQDKLTDPFMTGHTEIIHEHLATDTADTSHTTQNTPPYPISIPNPEWDKEIEQCKHLKDLCKGSLGKKNASSDTLRRSVRLQGASSHS